jgi:uncharacterized repeat protein (TIGR01451 family)
VGSPVEFRVVVENTGNVPLANVTLSGLVDLVIGDMAVNASSTRDVQVTATQAGSFNVTATVTGRFNGSTVNASDTAFYTVQPDPGPVGNPGISVQLSVRDLATGRESVGRSDV